MPVNETGHAINLKNFDTLIQNLNGFSTRYHPSNTALTIANLQALHTTAKADLKALGDAKTTRSTAENERKALFEPLETLVRRITASAKSAGATGDQLDDMEETARKIKGERAGTKNPDPVNPGDPHSISVSQQSYVNIAAHLSGLITTLSQVSAYDPNEDDLKLTALTTLQGQMETANTTVSGAEVAYQTAKTARNTSMYGEGTGLVDIAALVKDYVFSSSSQGAKNPDYKAIKGIAFTKLKKGS